MNNTPCYSIGHPLYGGVGGSTSVLLTVSQEWGAVSPILPGLPNWTGEPRKGGHGRGLGPPSAACESYSAAF